MVRRSWPFAIALLIGSLPISARAFDLVDSDRVVLVGNTFIERDQTYGYLETDLTLRHPGKNLIFRNLGWSGDTVFGEARASFDPPPVGFARLKETTLALKPTVILVGYGGVESFEGPEGLPRFRDGLKILLDTLAQTGARIVILSPLRHEDMGRPLPDPSRHNDDLKLYRDALKQAASERHYPFVDLFDALEDGAKSTPRRPLTDNGLHPNAYGAWRIAEAIGRGLEVAPVRWHVNVGPGKDEGEAVGARIPNLKSDANGARFEALDADLPPPPCPLPIRAGETREIRVQGLAPGKYTLTIDGVKVAIADATSWAKGVDLVDVWAKGGGKVNVPELEQVEALRRATIAKNRLFFHRWRPENETYLFGFRKHEQGKNGAEIVEFDPLDRASGEAAELPVKLAFSRHLIKYVAGPRTGGADRVDPVPSHELSDPLLAALHPRLSDSDKSPRRIGQNNLDARNIPDPDPGDRAPVVPGGRGVRGQPLCLRPAAGQADPDELGPQGPALGGQFRGLSRRSSPGRSPTTR